MLRDSDYESVREICRMMGHTGMGSCNRFITLSESQKLVILKIYSNVMIKEVPSEHKSTEVNLPD